MCLLERSTSIILTANSESIPQFLVSFQDLAWAFRKTGQLRFEAYHTRILSPRFEEALVYAAQLHADQLRKGTKVPHIAHLLGVASIVLEHGGNEDEAIAALLHDAVEDQGGDATRQQIRRRFGDEVTKIVDGCTDSDVLPKPPWKSRKRVHIAHLGGASRSILLVSAADKLDNARAIVADYRSLGEALWDRFTADKEGMLWYYRSLVGVYRQAGSNTALVDELDRVVAKVEQLASATALSTKEHGEP